MADFTYVSELLGDIYPTLDVCNNDGSPLSIFQWQCCGEFVPNINLGVRIEDELFINKSKKFINKAKEIKAGIVLTPEYSFPIQILKEIILNKSMWPDTGKLWCLGCQGENYSSLQNKLELWKGYQNINIIDNAFTNIQTLNNFLSPLFYLFIDNNNDLTIIPQFKTGQMADARNTYEGAYLCTGKEVFVFDLGKNKKCENAFLSLICADVLHINVNEINEKVKENNIVIFHPQLNSDPKNNEMVSFRQNMFKTSKKNIKIITLNWAEGTSSNDQKYKFDIPLSAFYKKNNGMNVEQNSSFRKIKENNHKKGTAYILNGHIDIWFSHRIEHCKFMYINKEDNGNSIDIVTHRDEPDTKACYVYFNGEWVSTNKYCSSNIKKIFDEEGKPYIFPYPICQNGLSCNKCLESDFFFGSLLGEFEKGEIECNNENISRILVGSDFESDKLRKTKLQLLFELNRILANNKFPKELNYLTNNYRFKVNPDFPEIGKRKYNLAPINMNTSTVDSEVLAVISRENSKEDVKNQYDKLSMQLSEQYRNQILIYYKPFGNAEYVLFDEPFNKSDITDPNYRDSYSSYKKPRFNIKEIIRKFRGGER